MVKNSLSGLFIGLYYQKYNFLWFVLASTPSHEFQTYLEQVKAEGDLLKTYFVDTVGSFIVEFVGDILEITLEGSTGFCVETI